ncbi:hypothetical protein Pla22_01570 [Rubripirellula amarantea]|uniref:Uncharacterized protein n=1 Tax=Rubripirellula amarantea TaxID=2527999 RepID=A0A5C5WR66_9BACT|nr:hypothetical protein Pla22_01570 [Rubripirellula amarantea]
MQFHARMFLRIGELGRTITVIPVELIETNDPRHGDGTKKENVHECARFTPSMRGVIRETSLLLRFLPIVLSPCQNVTMSHDRKEVSQSGRWRWSVR